MSTSTKELREVYRHFDQDGNGQIDRVEFIDMLHTLDPEIPEDEADLGYTIIDTDGNGLIDFEEFVAWWKHR